MTWARSVIIEVLVHRTSITHGTGFQRYGVVAWLDRHSGLMRGYVEVIDVSGHRTRLPFPTSSP